MRRVNLKHKIVIKILFLTFGLWWAQASLSQPSPDEVEAFSGYFTKQKQTASGEPLTWITYNGVDMVTQAPFYWGSFHSIANPNIPIPALNAKSLLYVDLMMNCFMYHPLLGPHYSSLDADDQALLLHLMKYYVHLYNKTNNVLEPAFGLDNITALCNLTNRPGETPSSYPFVDSYLGKTALGRLLKVTTSHQSEYYTYLAQFVDKWRGVRIIHGEPQKSFLINMDELFTIWLIAAMPDLMNTESTFKNSAFDGFIKRTSPSVSHINNFVMAGMGWTPWEELGMNKQSGWGFSAISSFIAKQYYEHPLLVSFIPLLGSGLDMFNTMFDLIDGKDMYGMDVSRFLSGGMLAINILGFGLDVAGASAATLSASDTLRKAVRSTDNVDDMKLIFSDYMDLVKNTSIGEVNIGEGAYDAATILGSPDPIWHTFWNRAIHPEPGGVIWGQKLWNDGVDEIASELSLYAMGQVSDIKTFEWLMYELQWPTLRTARELNLVGKDRFGMPLDTTLVSPVRYNGPFNQFKDILTEFAKKGDELEDGIVYLTLPASSQISVDLDGTKAWRNQVVGKINGQDIPMTMVTMYEYQLEHSNLVQAWGYIVHQDPANFSAFFPNQTKRALVRGHQEQLFQQVMTGNLTRKEIIDIVAELHWWEANLTNYSRGSNGMADVMSKLILNAKGIKTGLWKKGVSADFYAFVLDMDDFIKYYPQLFEHAPEDFAALFEEIMLHGSKIRGAYAQAFHQDWVNKVDGYVEFGVNSLGRNIARGYAQDRYRASYMEGDDDLGTSTWSPNNHSFPMQILLKKVLADGTRELVGAVAAASPVATDLPAQPAIEAEDPENIGFDFEIPEGLNVQELEVYALDPVSGLEKLLGAQPALCDGDPIDWDFGPTNIRMNRRDFNPDYELAKYKYPTPCRMMTYPGGGNQVCDANGGNNAGIQNYFSFRSGSSDNIVTWNGGSGGAQQVYVFVWDPEGTENGLPDENDPTIDPGEIFGPNEGYKKSWKVPTFVDAEGNPLLDANGNPAYPGMNFEYGTPLRFKAPAFANPNGSFYGYVSIFTNQIMSPPFVCTDSFGFEHASN